MTCLSQVIWHKLGPWEFVFMKMQSKSDRDIVSVPENGMELKGTRTSLEVHKKNLKRKGELKSQLFVYSFGSQTVMLFV